jgi:anti-sigma B factor antagonist
LLSNPASAQTPAPTPASTTVTDVSMESFDTRALSDPPYGCAVHRRGPTSEIALEGELDLAAKPVLDEAVETALAPGPVETLIVDFTRVTFADSTTMTWLVHANTRTEEAGGRLVVVVGPGPVRAVLRMTGIDELVALVGDDARTR